MEILKNIGTIVSVISGIISILMFFRTRKEKNECIKIKQQIDQSIKVLSKNSSIKSNDEFNIHKVGMFDNRKSID